MPKPGHPVERSPTVSDEREKIQDDEPERVAERVVEEVEEEDFEAHRLDLERADVPKLDTGESVDVGRVDQG